MFTGFDLQEGEEGYNAELQHIFHNNRLSVISGIGHYNADFNEVETIVFPPFSFTTTRERDIQHTNIYLYSLINYPNNFAWTLGGSGDFFEGGIIDRDQFNPKLGLTWNPHSNTTLRAAAFKSLRRTLVSSQTIEPTQVAGFNQFFEDPIGTEAWRYGIAIDQKLSKIIFTGVEFSLRELDVPFELISPPASPEVRQVDWDERLARAYIYWAPHPWFATFAEYQYELLERDPEFVSIEKFTEIKTNRLPLGINFFHPSGFRVGLQATYVDQEGKFGNPPVANLVPGEDQFWVLDMSIGYRLPKRLGLITIEAKNLLDENFKFQDTDPANPSIIPERKIFARITLAF
jgi:hypothetical protein